MGDELIQETCNQMEYTRLNDTDCADKDHEPLILPRPSQLPDKRTASHPEEQERTSHEDEQASEHSTLGKLTHRITIPTMSECIGEGLGPLKSCA